MFNAQFQDTFIQFEFVNKIKIFAYPKLPKASLRPIAYHKVFINDPWHDPYSWAIGIIEYLFIKWVLKIF